MGTRAPTCALRPGEISVDVFAGGGGISVAMDIAFGHGPAVALNHSRLALAMHAANHPETEHICCDAREADPRKVTRGRRVGHAHFSPDCTHYSIARGGKPFRDAKRARRMRGLAGIIPWWAETVRPRVISMENVREFVTWGPVLKNGLPCKQRAGFNFRRFVKRLQNLGYEVDWRVLNCADYGDPTSRERLFLIARCDGMPIVWPVPTHGPQGDLPYRVAADCIDFSLPCPSIFDTEEEIFAKYGLKAVRPLADNTLRRIARGVVKYVIENADPFIVPVMHGAEPRAWSIREPFRTITGAHRGDRALVIPTLINTRNGEREGQAPRIADIRAPFGTITATGSQGAIVSAFLAKHYGGHETPGSSLREPIDTITGRDHHALGAAFLMKMKGTSTAQAMQEPIHTIAGQGNHFAQVRALLIKFYSSGGQWADLRKPMPTSTGTDRLGLVMVHGEPHAIVDIGMRMLKPRELFNGNGLPPDYIIDPWIEERFDKRGRRMKPGPLPEDAQVLMCGNVVPPHTGAAVIGAQHRVEDQVIEVAA